uniref:C2H2-type domain-containing protein n=1 Tax=Malurus cyaneus samueli TaxID=2593467 RepID=A0A8C5TAY5_9PASS
PGWDRRRRRLPSPAGSTAAPGLYVSFPVLLVEEKPEPGTSPAPSAPPAGPAPDSDGLLLVFNVVRGAAEPAGRRQRGEPSRPAARRAAGGGPARPPAAAASSPAAGTAAPAGGDGGGSLLVRIENGVLTLGPAPSSPRARAPRPASPAEPPGGPRPRSRGLPLPGAALRRGLSRKQQLRLHRLSAHGGGEDGRARRRGLRLPLPGCAWSLPRPTSCGGTCTRTTNCGRSPARRRAAPSASPPVQPAAHSRAHEQEAAHKCEACGQRFPSAARLAAHRRRSHLEPERPYRCDFPGCERTFITVSALFSHNRAHFREQEQFSCSFPGCNKQYDKACRLKIHMRSHTGIHWDDLYRGKKHEDDRRFMCPVEGCGKSFTRAEHLKGHSITHLGTKPFECPVEGCCAKFSARSSLYIHSKKHLQDVDSLKTRCPVSNCSKLFTSKHSMKAHMVKQHNFSPDLLTQLDAASSLTPSSELTSPGQSDLSNIDLVSLFSNVSGNNSGITADMALVNSGIVTIDVASVGSALGGNLPVSNNSLSHAVDPLILVASSDMPQSLDSSLLLGTSAAVLQQSTLNLDDVQTVNAEALGSLASLSVRNSSQDVHGLTSSNNLTIDTATLTPSSSLGSTNVPELLTPIKAERNLLPSSDVVGQQEGSKVVTQFVFSNPPGSYSAQKEMDLGAVTGSSFLVWSNNIHFTPR